MTQPHVRRRPHRRATPLRVFVLLLTLVLATFAPSGLRAQQDATRDALPDPYSEGWSPVRTDSPRDTIASFTRVSGDLEAIVGAYLEDPSLDLLAEIALLSDELVFLINLEDVATATRRETGIRTFEYLMDIFGRIGDPDPLDFPDVDMIDQMTTGSMRIPQTPLRIERITEGEREGEYLFSAATVRIAPRFFAAIRHLPMDSPLEIESWSAFGPQQTGPLVPPEVVELMPDALNRPWLDTPAWKVIFEVALLALFGTALLALGRLLHAIGRGARVTDLVLRTVPPLLAIYGTTTLLPFIARQVHLSGSFAKLYDAVLTVITYGAMALLFWLVVRIMVESVIRSPRIPDEGLDADLLRLGAGTFGLIGALIFLAFGGQAIGLPVLSVVAGLGIGGLAVALAVRPTFENLIGGVILYIDRPVRVGDFCTVGSQQGTVEGIGIRSTKLRALDRTIISIPNAQFADMQIINWAQCDRMLINETVGLRYDTSMDQMRHVLARLRRMLHAHPRIDGDTVRVRFSGFGDSALNVNIRIYAATHEWNDFHAIREDVFLRVFDIIRESGTDIAFPSQTLYMARDTGLDPDRSTAAEAEVQGWRRSGTLPFPRLSEAELDRLAATLDYPPYGSQDAGGREEEIAPERSEPLSADPEDATAETTERAPGTDRGT
ncbi:mechanosensitive ion channel family protein [Marinibacterium profundimaris]|uniref:mechanosensitive ion channel family protein n=1 Tax=Marinibacterium profundimaris TaxID=1679460 RepID=UPI000B528206|nr:mechanosensitive ion channel family protein [Marinibacterium profundimaris]